MTRKRSTWSRSDGNPRQAATSRQADIYTMNQEHPQPTPVEYENGDPDSWAETPTKNQNVDLDYDGDRVKRNELNFGEIRPDTFDHKDSDEWGGGGKYDNQREATAKRKAQYATHVARRLLRSENDDMVEAQAIDLMALPPRALVSTMKRLRQASPDALPQEAKYRRALACCKLAQNMVPDSATEDDVQLVASKLMMVDDPTLKGIIRSVASISTRIAGEDESEESDDDQTASQQPTAAPQEPTAAAPQEPTASQQPTAAPQEPTATQEPTAAPDPTASSELSAADIAALDQMLEEEACVEPMMAPAPAGPAAELTELFAPAPEAAPAMPAAPVAPAAPIASGGNEITFDEDDEDPAGRTAGDSAELDNLFSDNDEVQAQREIRAAEQTGYGAAPVTRTASHGAKRIGNVRPPAPKTADDELSQLWEGPGA